jgi:O-antigen/teichoic acid export membrane protein
MAIQVDDKLVPVKKNKLSRIGPIVADSEGDTVSVQKATSRATIAGRVGVPTIYLLLGNLFTLAVGLPLQIYIARVLGAAGIGVYGLLEAVMNTASGLLGFGVAMTVVRFVPEHLARREYGEVVGLIRVSALFLFATSGLAYTVLLFVLFFLGTLWPSVEGYRLEIGIMGLMIPLSLITSFLQQGLRGFQDIRGMVVGLSVIQLTMKAVLTIGAFAIGLGLDGYMLASILASFSCVIWLFYSLVDQIRALPFATPTISPLPKWRRFALASYSGSLLGTATSGLDRLLLGAFIGSSAVGILVVVRQLQMLPERFNQMLLVTTAPLFSAAHGANDRRERQYAYHLTTDWAVRSSLPLVLFLWLFGRDVLALFGSAFADTGTVPLWILVGAQFFSVTSGPVGNLAMMSGLEWPSLRLSVINTILGVGALAVLTPFFGLTGVAVAYALIIVLQNVTFLILVQRKLHLQWWDRRYLEWLPQFGAALAVASIALSLTRPLSAAELAICLVAMYVGAVAVTFVRGWHENDKQLFRHIRQAVRSATLP